MSDPFKILNAINKHDVEFIVDSGYEPFLVNRGLSYFPDTIHLAQQMNISTVATGEMQYSFLLNTVRPRKRYSKWAKKAVDAEVNIIAKRYKVNDVRAKEIMQILPKDTIEKIITKESEKYG